MTAWAPSQAHCNTDIESSVAGMQSSAPRMHVPLAEWHVWHLQRHGQAAVLQALSACGVRRSFLRSLDQRNISNGAAEMLKMACIKDAPLFSLLEAQADILRANHFQVWAFIPFKR